MNNHNLARCVFALGMTAAGSNALAADSGPYLGAGVGAYSLELDADNFDDNETFARVFAGWRISENFALEADFQKLAESSDDVFGANVELEADTWSVVARPILPLTPFLDLYGRVGWAWYDVEATSNLFGTPVRVGGDDDDFTWGGGVDLHFGDHLSLRGDFSRIEIEDADLNLLSASVVFRF